MYHNLLMTPHQCGADCEANRHAVPNDILPESLRAPKQSTKREREEERKRGSLIVSGGSLDQADNCRLLTSGRQTHLDAEQNEFTVWDRRQFQRCTCFGMTFVVQSL